VRAARRAYDVTEHCGTGEAGKRTPTTIILLSSTNNNNNNNNNNDTETNIEWAVIRRHLITVHHAIRSLGMCFTATTASVIDAVRGIFPFALQSCVAAMLNLSINSDHDLKSYVRGGWSICGVWNDMGRT
jgi:hypothetical protein